MGPNGAPTKMGPDRARRSDLAAPPTGIPGILEHNEHEKFVIQKK